MRSPLRHIDFLLSVLPTRIVAAIALCLGAVYAFAIFEPAFILGHSVYWTQPYADRMHNMIGALYFARDAWRFPLFFVPKVSFPEGANIVFMDSLPLLALFFKIVYQLLGEWFNYFGLWIFACFPLVALFAALAAKEAGVREATAQLGAALIALASPALLFRFGHAALMGQFLILWSIFLYYRLRNAPGNRGAVVQFCFAAALAVLLQAYFVIMVMPFLVAALAQSVAERRSTVRRAAIDLTTVTAVLLATTWVAGIIGAGRVPATQWGFGHYSMNLLSPFLPPRERLPEALAGLVTWDGNGHTWDATGGQGEGYNYLGAGMLFLAAIHVVASGRLAGAALKRHGFLLLMLAGYFVFALSNRVFIGDWLALEFRVPAPLIPLIGHFRTGGRLFWPIYYVLAVALVLATFQRFTPRLARILIVVAVGLQLADTQFLRRNVAQATRHGYPQVLSQGNWTRLLETHEYLKQYPSFQCGGWAGKSPDNNSNLELLWLAAKLDKPTNSAYLSRLNRDCTKELSEGLEFDVRAEGLTVYGTTFPIQRIQGLPHFRDWCRSFEHGIVCSRNWSVVPARASLSDFKPVTQDFTPEVALGEVLKFSAGGNGAQFLGAGWSVLEPWGVWTIGDGSEIALRIPTAVKVDIRLSVGGYAFVHAKRPVQEIAVFVNGKQVANWTYSAGDRAKTYTVDVPRSLIPESGTLGLRLVPKVVESPEAAGVSADRRLIGFGLMEMSVSLALEPAQASGLRQPK